MALLCLQVNLAGIGVSVIEASVTKLAREVMHISFTGVEHPPPPPAPLPGAFTTDSAVTLAVEGVEALKKTLSSVE